MSEPLSITHNRALSRFEAQIGDQLAYVEYETKADRRVFTHTFVPDSLRGQGIAQALVKEALEDARRNKLQVVSECSYVSAYLKRHPTAASGR